MSLGRFHNPYFQRESVRRAWLRRDGWAIGGSLILAVILTWYVFGYHHALAVQQLDISGQQYLTVDQITAATTNALAQRRWLLLSQRFLPILDETQLQTDITEQLSQYIQMEAVVVTSDWPSTLHVRVTERVPGYVYITGKDQYYLDIHGVATQQVKAAEADPHFPHIRERNKKRDAVVGSAVLQESVMNFVTALHSAFTPATSLDIAEYAVLPVTCQTKQYVTDKIFADEIAGSKTETAKQQKRSILDKLQNNKITVDQSLDLLEGVKRGEQANDDGANETFITWQTEYTNITCDYVMVVQDVAVVTQPGVEIYFDSALDLQIQLDNLATVLTDVDPAELEYIDVRFTDRAYYR